ncbi:MAG: N-acetylglucosamine-6-phosphate deacetylase [Ruminococcus sp.]|nr:N-acetylglucosamine-6-phosphate deacetylase [Ruminococcus sp.]
MDKKLTVLKDGTVFTKDCTFAKMNVCFADGEIISLTEDVPGGAEVIGCEDLYVLPGLTDVHLHGCAGQDLSEASQESLAAMADFEYRHGVTAFCPAVMTLPDGEISRILRGAAEYAKNAPADTAEIAGINLEGPFVSAEKCGAQNAAYIASPSAEKLRKWQSGAGGLIKLVTIAPELSGAVGCIRECAGEFRFSLGHTACDYDTAMAAFAAGADHVTHLFNAMPAFHHRDAGLIGAAFDTAGCFAELICDGVHVCASAVRAAFKLFGDDRIVLISDSMEAAGMPDGEYMLGGQKVIKRGSRAELEDGTLAGSVSTLYDCLRKAAEFGIPLESAVKAATRNPCLSAGLYDEIGSIEPGKKARFLILRRDLTIKTVI